MFDPDNPDKPKSKPIPILAKGNLPNPRLIPMPGIPMGEKDRLRFYLVNCAGTRKSFGFAMNKNRKLYVEDKAKLERLDAETKAILRELYLELK